jgi:hypothetical protein
MESFMANQLPHQINQWVAEALQVKRIRTPQTYSKEKVDILVQQAVQEALEETTGKSREITPRGLDRNLPAPKSGNPEAISKGKGWDSPSGNAPSSPELLPTHPQTPPTPPQPSRPLRPSGSSLSAPTEPRSPALPRPQAKGKRGENYHFNLQVRASGENPQPRWRDATEP